VPYFLNLVADEGRTEEGYIQFAPNGDPIGPLVKRSNDGDDVLFGDEGNDWIVGGTGRDHMYGGWGNDLLNGDDVLGTVDPEPPQNSPGQLPVGGTDAIPDTHIVYEDRVFGGAGLDILIGNTGGDRLIDYTGEYNSYLVPFAPFGIATVSRQVPPQLFDFLWAQAFSDGVDSTRVTDIGEQTSTSRYSNVGRLQAEPYGEMGLVTQRDHGLWQQQTGGPTDPQPGNIPGGRRDVLRSSDFNDGLAQGFFVDSGQWTVSSGRLEITPMALGEDAAAVYYVDDYLPNYFEMKATINAGKPTGGYKANAYLIFDYQSPTDFKFAGIDDSINKMVMGRRDATGWHVDKQNSVPGGIKYDKNYDLLLAINGTVATLVFNNNDVFTHVYEPRVIDGFSFGLNNGLVGIGADNSVARIDNVAVQILPPEWTYEATDDFSDGVADLFTAIDGGWQVVGARYDGDPAPDELAISTYDLSVAPDTVLELETTFSTASTGGLVFDLYESDDFKFVALSPVTDEVLVGHYTPGGGWQVDASAPWVIDADTDYDLGLTLKGTGVNVTVNGQSVIGHAFNGLVVDGEAGLISQGGVSSFDSFTIRSNDLDLLPPEGGSLIAADGQAATLRGDLLTQAELSATADAAIGLWQSALGDDEPMLARLTGVRFAVADLDGPELGRSEGSVVYIDKDAAGHGWFIDPTPGKNNEFGVRLDDDVLMAEGGSDAYGAMDLLTAVSHEIGHSLGFDHDDALAVMQDELDPGVRFLIEELGFDQDPEQPVSDQTLLKLALQATQAEQMARKAATRSSQAGSHDFEFDAVVDTRQTRSAGKVDWDSDHSGWSGGLSSLFGKGRTAANFADFLSSILKDDGDDNTVTSTGDGQDSVTRGSESETKNGAEKGWFDL
jgi:hypothetical protein